MLFRCLIQTPRRLAPSPQKLPLPLVSNVNKNFFSKYSRTTVPSRFFSTTPTIRVFKSPLPTVGTPDLYPYTDYLLDSALDRNQDPAFLNADTGETLTYGQLREKVNDLAIQFYIRGWEQGQTVAVIMPNKTIYPITVLAAAKIGIKVTLINPKYKSRMMIKQLRHSKTEYIITTAELVHYVRDACQALRTIKEILILDRVEEERDKKDYRLSLEMKYNLLLGKPPGWGALPEWVVKAEEVMCLPYTANGEKGVELTHAQVTKSLLQIGSLEPNVSSTDVFVVALPYHDPFNFFFSGTFPWLHGAKSILMQTFDLKKFLEIVQEHKVTYAHLPVTALNDLAKTDLIENFNLSSLRVLFTTENLEINVINDIEKKIPNVKVKLGYGVNELTPPIIFTPTEIKKGSAGILLPDTFAKVVDPNTKEELGVDKEGDLYVKGEQIMSGYYQNPDETTKDVDADGFFHTGDRAKVDSDGYWWVTRQKK